MDDDLPASALAAALAVPSPVPSSEWPALGRFIFRHNRSAAGGVRCLHGDQGDDEQSHVAELAALPADEAAFWCATDAHGQLIGVVGCEMDLALRRAWLRGPWVASAQPASPLAAALLDTLERALPGILCFDAFPSEDDAPLAALYGGAGYRHMAVHRVMQAALGPNLAASAADPRITPTRPDELRQWLPLHHGLFPAAYLSDDDIAAALDDRERLVLTAWRDGQPAGYLVAKDDARADELYVDYLGVAPAARGGGLGRALLLHAMRWAAGRGRPRATLTVRVDRAEALSLYRRCGFQQLRAGVHWRKERPAPEG